MSKAITAIDSANTSATIIACKILLAADGLRPSARMLAYPIEAITAEGPITVRKITRKMTVAEGWVARFTQITGIGYHEM